VHVVQPAVQPVQATVQPVHPAVDAVQAAEQFVFPKVHVVQPAVQCVQPVVHAVQGMVQPTHEEQPSYGDFVGGAAPSADGSCRPQNTDTTR
jgi:hypothetical protein